MCRRSCRIEREQAWPTRSSVYQVVSMMEGVVQARHGHAGSAAVGKPLAGKTGHHQRHPWTPGSSASPPTSPWACIRRLRRTPSTLGPKRDRIQRWRRRSSSDFMRRGAGEEQPAIPFRIPPGMSPRAHRTPDNGRLSPRDRARQERDPARPSRRVRCRAASSATSTAATIRAAAPLRPRFRAVTGCTNRRPRPKYCIWNEHPRPGRCPVRAEIEGGC